MKNVFIIMIGFIASSCKNDNITYSCIVGDWNKVGSNTSISFTPTQYLTDALPINYKISGDTLIFSFGGKFKFNCNDSKLSLSVIGNPGTPDSLEGNYIRR